MRLMINTFKIGKPFPTAEDFAIAIGFELDYQEIKIQSVILRKFATNLRREWCRKLNLKLSKHPCKIKLKNVAL